MRARSSASSLAKRLPARGLFERLENHVETIAQIREHVISVDAAPVASVQRRGSTHEHGTRHEGLHVPFGGQQPFPFRQAWAIRWHAGNSATIALGMHTRKHDTGTGTHAE